MRYYLEIDNDSPGGRKVFNADTDEKAIRGAKRLAGKFGILALYTENEDGSFRMLLKDNMPVV